MSDLVTVLAVTYPPELYIIKGRLESEGIKCFVKDELIVQANSLYSNAVGGVKLQVQQHDVGKAVQLLTELGYLKNEPVKIDLLTQIDTRTSSIPLLKNANVINRILIITLIAVVLITTLFYFVLK